MSAGRDGGSGSVLVVGLVGACLLLAAGAAAAGQLAVAAARAASAADAAALAGAALAGATRPAVDGPSCARAGAVAVAAGAELVACSTSPAGVVDVVVRTRAPGAAGDLLEGLLGGVGARARAGPPP